MLTIAVTGATGAQGGATARALLEAGHHVRALTRHPGAPAARRLQALGAELRRADFDDRTSMAAAFAGADAVFAVTTPFGTDRATETRQGIDVVDTAAEAAVGHVVLTTTAHADRRTAIPHYDSKYLVERHLRASGVPWTVLGPAAFMDNFASGWTRDGLRDGYFGWPMPADRPLTLIPAADIGVFAALVLQRRDEFAGQRIDIAADERTPAEMTGILADVLHRPLEFRPVPLDRVRQWSDDLAAMFGYFTTTGLDVDVAGLRRDYPEVGWHTFDEWARAAF